MTSTTRTNPAAVPTAIPSRRHVEGGDPAGRISATRSSTFLKVFFLVTAFVVAVPTPVTAGGLEHPGSAVAVPGTIPFREVEGIGLIASVWVNGAGPFRFALDTGAGCAIASDRVARESHLDLSDTTVPIAGLSGLPAAARQTAAARLAAGSSDNVLPSTSVLLVTDALPEGVDGVLDPAIAVRPLGFVMDLPSGELRCFDPLTSPVRATGDSPDSVVVAWLGSAGSLSPVVSIGHGRKALVDTGSQFGLAIGTRDVLAFGAIVQRTSVSDGVVDLGGGAVRSRRATTPTLDLGGMVLSNVPTQVLLGTDSDTQILLGRDALRPFEITFDPHARLIQIARVTK